MSDSTISRPSVKTNSQKNGKAPKEVLPEPVEHHDRQFRGTFAPALLHDLVEKDKISFAAAWLVMVIDSLSQNGKGCYAKNEYLGMKMHLKKSRIGELLKELESAKLLWSKWEGKRRYLKIDWTCDSEKERKTSYAANTRVPENRESESRKTGSVKTAPHYVLSNNKNSKSQCRSPASDTKSETIPDEMVKPTTDNSHPIEETLADDLREAFRKAGSTKFQPPSKWVEAIVKTINDVMQRDSINYQTARKLVVKIFKDHAAHIKDDYQPKLYTPWRMREEFVRLENAYKRRHDPKPAKKFSKNGYHDPNRLRDDEII